MKSSRNCRACLRVLKVLPPWCCFLRSHCSVFGVPVLCHNTKEHRERGPNTKILLPLARHLEERLIVRESVSQSGKQLVGQAGKQTGRQKHTVGLFFSGELQLQTVWSKKYIGITNGRVVEHSTCNQACVSSNPGRPSPATGDRPVRFFSPNRGSNPSEHKLLTPPLPPTPLKCDIQFQGDRGLKMKNSIGGSFCRAK